MQTIPDNDRLFMGLDSSTQGLKATVIDLGLGAVAEYAVNYDRDLPEFHTEGGVHRDGLVVTASPVMWLAALDVLLARMKEAGFLFSRVSAISGSGQQHGSVYLGQGTRLKLQGLRSEASLRDQLADAFATDRSPVWMDSSTASQCRERDLRLGGPQCVAELTGSRSYERFTGNQIAKIYETQRDVYDSTEHIALVSSFMAGLAIGDYAPIDTSDGSGMNLMDIRTKSWDASALDVTAPELERKLGPLVPAHCVIGGIHRYYVERYGFAPGCRVVAFSGDNPNSLAGLRLQEAGHVAISLGTSDTVFGSLTAPKPSATEGHIFASPVDPAGYMALICYKNGSLTREKIRDERTDGSWDSFNRVLADAPPGNGGRIGFYIVEPEITPPVTRTGIHRFGPGGQEEREFPVAADVRAVVEGQFLSMRLHGANVGLQPARILATGGASANPAILQVMSNVFGVPVFTGDQPNSASLGAAYRALHGWRCEAEKRFIPFSEVMAGASPFVSAAAPDAQSHAVYDGMVGRYAELEKRLVEQV